MNQSDLMIGIGADTTAFALAMEQIEKKFTLTYKNIQNQAIHIDIDEKRMMQGLKQTSDAFKNEIERLQKVAKIELKVDDEEALSIAKNMKAGLDKAQAEIDAFNKERVDKAKIVADKEKEIRTKLRAELSQMNVNPKNTQDIDKLRKRLAVEKQLIRQNLDEQKKGEEELSAYKEQKEKMRRDINKTLLFKALDEEEAGQKKLSDNVTTYDKERYSVVTSLAKQYTDTVEKYDKENADMRVRLAREFKETRLRHEKQITSRINSDIKERGNLEQATIKAINNANKVAKNKEKNAAEILWKREYANIKRNEKLVKNIMSKKTYASKKLEKLDLTILSNKTNKELRDIAKISNARTASSIKTATIPTKTSQGSSNWDFAGHRGLLDSAKVVAKYGLISQALFGIQNAFRAVVDEAIRFDQGMAQISAVLDITGDSARDLENVVVDLGKRFGTDFAEIQEGMITLGRAGVENIEQLKAGTEGLAALSVITGDAMHYGASAMASMIAVYPQLAGNMGNLSDKMGEVANATRLGLEDFSTINNYALTTAKNIGMTSDTYLAFAGALSKVGLNASTIGTSMRRMDRLMSDSSKSVSEMFRRMNMSQEEFAQSMRTNSKGALTEFVNTLNQMSVDQFEKAVAGLPIRIKATVKSLKQLGSVSEGTDTILAAMFKKVEDSKDVMKQADKNAVGLAAGLGRIGNTIKSSFTNQLADIMNSVFDTKNIKDFQTSLDDLLGRVAGVVTVLGELAAIYVLVNTWSRAAAIGISLSTAAAAAQTGVITALAVAWEKLGIARGVGIIAAGVVAGSELGKYALTKAEENYSGSTKEEIGRMQDEARLAANKDQVAVLKDMNIEYQKTENTLAIIDRSKKSISDATMTDLQRSLALEGVNKRELEIKKEQEKIQGNITDLYSVETAEIEKRKKFNEENRIGKGVIPGAPTLDDKGEEYARREQVAIEKLNGSYSQLKYLKIDLDSLNKKLNSTSAEDVNARAKISMQIAEKELAIKKENVRLTKETGTDSTKGAGAADKRAKAADREAKAITKMSVLKAKITIQEQKNAIIAKGGIVTDKIKYQNELKILAATRQEAKAVYDAAKARENGIQSIKATEEAHLKYLQAVGKEQEKMNEPLEDMFESIADGLEEAFDAVMSGDINGAIKDLFMDMMKMGAKATLEAIANSQLVAESSAIAAIARAASESTWVGMAAMAAAMAAIGAFSGSIGSGPSISEAEMTQATGGNTALSDSATNALEAIEANGVEGLVYSQRMADSLDMLVRMSDKASASLGDSVSGRDYVASNRDGFWSNTSKELVSSGIMISPASLDDLANANLEGFEYLTEKVTKEGWFTGSEELRTSKTGDLDTGFVDAYTDAFMQGVEALQQAAEVLGVTEAQFDQFAAEWEMLEQNLNFEGMDADERTELIVQSLSANLDSLGETLLPLIPLVDEFAVGGEKVSETIIRLANEFEVVELSMRNLGIVMPAVANGGVAFSQALIGAFGTMEKFSEFMNWFTQNFFSDEERLAMATTNLQISFAALGMVLPATRDGFRIMTLQLIEDIRVKVLAIKVAKEQLAAAKAVVESQIMTAQASIAGSTVTATAAIAAGSAAMLAAGATAQAIEELQRLQGLVDGFELDLGGLQDKLGMISENTGNLDIYYGGIDDISGAMDTGAAAATGMGGAVSSLSQEMEDFTQQHIDANFSALSLLDTIYGDLMSVFEDFAGAMEDLYGKLELRTLSLNEALEFVNDATMENYKAILQQLDESRKQDEDDIAKFYGEMIKTLDETRKFVDNMIKDMKKIENAIEKIVHIAKGTSVEGAANDFYPLYDAIMVSIANGESISEYVSDFISAGNELVKAVRGDAGTSREAEFETLRVAAMMRDALKGAPDEATLDTIDATLQATYKMQEDELERVRLKYEEGILQIADILTEEFHNTLDELAIFYAQYLGTDSPLIGVIQGLHDITADQWTAEQQANIAARNAEDEQWRTANAEAALTTAALKFNTSVLDAQMLYTSAGIITAQNLGEYATKFMTSEMVSWLELGDANDQARNDTLATYLINANNDRWEQEGIVKIRDWAVYTADAKVAYAVNTDQSKRDWAIYVLERDREVSLLSWNSPIYKRMLLDSGSFEVMKTHLSSMRYRDIAKELYNTSKEGMQRFNDAVKNSLTYKGKSAPQLAFEQVQWANNYMVDKCTFTSTINNLRSSNWNGSMAVVSAVKGISSSSSTTTNNYYPAAPVGVSVPAPAHLAEGGIINRPIHALIGEAGYSEAVIPLKDPNDPLGMKKTNNLLQSMDDRLKSIEFTNDKIRLSSKRQVTVSEESAFLIEERL